MNAVIKPTPIYWLISIIALLWNYKGVTAYLGQAYMTDEALKMLQEENQLYFSNLPAWVTAAFAVAVFGGFLGSIGLIIRKKWAYFMYIISFFQEKLTSLGFYIRENVLMCIGTSNL